MARSSAVIVSQPNANKYRPGSVTCPTCAQVILLTTNLLSPSPSVRFQHRRQITGTDSFILQIKHVSLTVHHLAVLGDRHVDAGAAIGIDYLDPSQRIVCTFPPLFHRSAPT